MNSLPVVAFETEGLRPRYARHNPHLAHVVWLCGAGVAFDEVLELAGEDFSVRVTCDACWVVGGEDEDDWAGDVAG